MAKKEKGKNEIDLLSSKKKAHIKQIQNVLYQNKIMSIYCESSRGFVLCVNIKNLVQAIKIASKYIQENNLQVELCNIKYWQAHASEMCLNKDKEL